MGNKKSKRIAILCSVLCMIVICACLLHPGSFLAPWNSVTCLSYNPEDDQNRVWSFISAPSTVNPEDESLSELKSAVWEYAKNYSGKSEWPYLVSGTILNFDNHYYFYINAYSNCPRNSAILPDSCIASAIICEIDPDTYEITEQYHMSNARILWMTPNVLYAVDSQTMRIERIDLETNSHTNLGRIKNNAIYYVDDDYVEAIIYHHRKYTSQILYGDNDCS